MKLNIDDLKRLVKSATFVARKTNDDDLFKVAYLVEALEDDDLFAAISADIEEETGEALELVTDEG